MAGTTGLEPATSAVTGQRSNQLSYVPRCAFRDVSKSAICVAALVYQSPCGDEKQGHAPLRVLNG